METLLSLRADLSPQMFPSKTMVEWKNAEGCLDFSIFGKIYLFFTVLIDTCLCKPDTFGFINESNSSNLTNFSFFFVKSRTARRILN